VYRVIQLPEFSHWLCGLRDGMTRLRLARRLERVQNGLLGDVVPVGNGVWEMREFFGPGWRMYYMQHGSMLIVMLGGGDKSTQPSDIARAIRLSRQISLEQLP